MDAPFARGAGVILLLISISWNRMGPSDSRYRIALLTATVGFALLIGRDLLAPSDLYDRLSSDGASQDMGVVILHLAIWALLLAIGSMLTIRGSRVYGVVSPTTLFTGWLLVISSISVAMVFRPGINLLDPMRGLFSIWDALSAAPIILGMISGLIAAVALVAWSEFSEPPLPPTPELDDDERMIVRKIVEDHLRGVN
ncbi:MAG: hypothetical protein ACJZ4X_02615 [Candidatus Thalassarchaeaceae archaeon]|tara:strand:+ start:511 stop:1104 length:594 start_codon:yes stop_codon:yes gene_type:complete